jgi:hypothetical protein
MSTDFKTQIQQLLEYEKIEEDYKSKLKKIKEQKEKLEQELIQYIEENQYQETNFVYQNKNIKYATQKTQETITKKLIHERLTLFFQNEKKAEDAVFFIYTDREVKKKPILRINDIKTK